MAPKQKPIKVPSTANKAGPPGPRQSAESATPTTDSEAKATGPAPAPPQEKPAAPATQERTPEEKEELARKVRDRLHAVKARHRAAWRRLLHYVDTNRGISVYKELVNDVIRAKLPAMASKMYGSTKDAAAEDEFAKNNLIRNQMVYQVAKEALTEYTQAPVVDAPDTTPLGPAEKAWTEELRRQTKDVEFKLRDRLIKKMIAGAKDLAVEAELSDPVVYNRICVEVPKIIGAELEIAREKAEEGARGEESVRRELNRIGMLLDNYLQIDLSSSTGASTLMWSLENARSRSDDLDAVEVEIDRIYDAARANVEAAIDGAIGKISKEVENLLSPSKYRMGADDGEHRAAIDQRVRENVTKREVYARVAMEQVGAIVDEELRSIPGRLGPKIDARVPEVGDSTSFALQLKIPVPLPGVYIGLQMSAEAARTAKGVNVALSVKASAGFQIPGIFNIEGTLGGFVRATGKDAKHALELIWWTWYRRAIENGWSRSTLDYFWGTQTPGSHALWAAAVEEKMDAGKHFAERGNTAGAGVTVGSRLLGASLKADAQDSTRYEKDTTGKIVSRNRFASSKRFDFNLPPLKASLIERDVEKKHIVEGRLVIDMVSLGGIGFVAERLKEILIKWEEQKKKEEEERAGGAGREAAREPQRSTLLSTVAKDLLLSYANENIKAATKEATGYKTLDDEAEEQVKRSALEKAIKPGGDAVEEQGVTPVGQLAGKGIDESVGAKDARHSAGKQVFDAEKALDFKAGSSVTLGMKLVSTNNGPWRGKIFGIDESGYSLTLGLMKIDAKSAHRYTLIKGRNGAAQP